MNLAADPKSSDPGSSHKDPRSRWRDTLVILLTIIAALYLGQIVWGVLVSFADIILLFALAWLVAFTLEPLIKILTAQPLPRGVGARVNKIIGEPNGVDADTSAPHYHLARVIAVSIVYLIFFLVLLAAVVELAPTIVEQMTALATQIPTLMTRAPEVASWLEGQLTRFGLRVDVGATILKALEGLQSLATPALQNVIGVFNLIVSAAGSLTLVLILSFIIALDGHRLFCFWLNLVPQAYRDKADVLIESVQRSFGGFMRALFTLALLQGLGVYAAMVLLQVRFAEVASILSGLFMLIPLVGPILAAIPPLAVSLFVAQDAVVYLLIFVLVWSVILNNVVSPRLMGEAAGLHPLFIFAAILVGVKIAGFWGAFFSVPIAGVLAAMLKYLYEEHWNPAAKRGKK
jgi:predicted PurR-regulated permease PerM